MLRKLILSPHRPKMIRSSRVQMMIVFAEWPDGYESALTPKRSSPVSGAVRPKAVFMTSMTTQFAAIVPTTVSAGRRLRAAMVATARTATTRPTA
ncbi:hypothetical protein GCM10009765_57280 [Fodinicola feengrottensis]|uniref:Uncharacterized protein n=1 Tax=Fodinicola feengrottensis TaxID=435914 RepID=A0ABP4UAV6_9ACTN